MLCLWALNHLIPSHGLSSVGASNQLKFYSNFKTPLLNWMKQQRKRKKMAEKPLTFLIWQGPLTPYPTLPLPLINKNKRDKRILSLPVFYNVLLSLSLPISRQFVSLNAHLLQLMTPLLFTKLPCPSHLMFFPFHLSPLISLHWPNQFP